MQKHVSSDAKGKGSLAASNNRDVKNLTASHGGINLNEAKVDHSKSAAAVPSLEECKSMLE